MGESEESRGLGLVYAPSRIFGVLFAERDVARRTAQVWHAVQDSTTWGEFRAAMPATDWEQIVEMYEAGYERDIPPDDTPFTPNDVNWGEDGYYLRPWLPEEEVKWFPEDLIEKYGGAVDWANPNYDQLSLPREAADDIAEELRARGHQVEKTFTGDDLNYWLEWSGDPPVSEASESTKSSSTGRPILISTEGKSKEQIIAEARQALAVKHLVPEQRDLQDSWSPGHATIWGPYFEAMFPPRRVTAWDNFKRKTTGLNVVLRLWDQREEMRQEYEVLHGTNHAQWPVQHPGVVLDAVPMVAHPACLTCHWFHHGVAMKEADWRNHAAELAARHQDSDGAYNDDERD